MKLLRQSSIALILVLFTLPLSGWAKDKAVKNDKADKPAAKADKDAEKDNAAAPAAEPGAKPEEAPTQMLVRLVDFRGATTTKVVTPQEYREIKKDMDKDNEALRVAYNTVRKDWRESQPTIQRKTVYIQGHRRDINVRVPVPPFPLKCPPPKESHLIGQYKDPAALEAKQKELTAKEEARIARLEKEADKKDAALAGSKTGLKRPEPKQPKNDKADLEKDKEELMTKLLDEVEKIRIGSTPAAKGGAAPKAIKRIGQ